MSTRAQKLTPAEAKIARALCVEGNRLEYRFGYPDWWYRTFQPATLDSSLASASGRTVRAMYDKGLFSPRFEGSALTLVLTEEGRRAAIASGGVI